MHERGEEGRSARHNSSVGETAELKDQSIAELQAVLSALTYSQTRARSHERLAAEAGTVIDRPGLALLRALAVEGGPLPVVQLADRLDVRHPHVIRKVRELAEQGFVERVAHGSDRREQPVALTREGQDALERFESTSREWLAEGLADVSAEEISAASELLRRIAAHAGCYQYTANGKTPNARSAA